MRARGPMLAVFLAGCPATDIYGATAGHSASGASGRATSGPSSATSSSSGGPGTGTTTGGSTGGTGGTTGTTGSPGTKLNCRTQPFDACDAGFEILSQAWDSLKESPVTAIQVSNLGNGATTAVSEMDGLIEFCAQPDSIVAPEIEASGYVTTIFQDIDLTMNRCFLQLPLFEDAIWSAYLNGISNYDSTSTGTIIATVGAANGDHVCDPAGWAFAVTYPDGGPVAFSVAYVSGTLVSLSATSTSEDGIAIMYNIDLSGGTEVAVVGIQQGDAGAIPCGPALSSAGYTGLVHIAGNGTVSSFSFVTIDAG